MGFSQRIHYFLVHQLLISNKEARQLIEEGRVEAGGRTVQVVNQLLDETSEIRVNGQVIRHKKEWLYLRFYKPRGFESSLNPAVADNLSPFFTDGPPLAIAGRLDKQSEGLLLLSNDGKWVERMCHPRYEKEKEYLVHLDKSPTNAFLETFRSGVRIGAYLTAPCTCEATGGEGIRVILKEGKNRQIRRMCHKLGYQVMALKRVRIDQHCLGALLPGQKQAWTPVPEQTQEIDDQTHNPMKTF